MTESNTFIVDHNSQVETQGREAYVLLESGRSRYLGAPYDPARAENLRKSGEPVAVIEAGGKPYMGLFLESLSDPISEDGDQLDWNPTTSSYLINSFQRRRMVDKVRTLCEMNSHAFRALKLYQDYVLGEGTCVELVLGDEEEDETEADRKIISQANKAWKAFLKANRRWWTPREFGRRAWRDGEQFTWLQKSEWPPQVRFLEPEEISDGKATSNNPNLDRTGEGQGIVTDDNDITQVVKYNHVNVVTGKVLDDIPADEMIHTKIDCDSGEKRGKSRFLPAMPALRQFPAFLEVEVVARKLQASHVLQRKVSGGATKVQAIADNARTSTSAYGEGSLGREKIRPGTILNTSSGIEYQFLSPATNYQDATALARQILLQVVVATGWPEFMLLGAGENANLGSSQVIESSTGTMVKNEQGFFRDELMRVYEWVMQKAIAAGKLKGITFEELWERFEANWTFPEIMTRDWLQSRQADNIDRMNQTISMAQARRNGGYNNGRMKREIAKELEEMPPEMMMGSAMNPSMAAKQKSSQGNAAAGGTNQGSPGQHIQHSDKKQPA